MSAAGLKDIRGWTSPTHNLEPVFVFHFGINNAGHTHGLRKRGRMRHKLQKGSASAALHGPRSLKQKFEALSNVKSLVHKIRSALKRESLAHIWVVKMRHSSR